MSNYLNPINTMRFGGLASGIDTESMVQDMMQIEHMKVDRIKQDRQVVEWRRDAYRDITNKLRSFKDKFLDIIRPENYMLSPNTYKNYKTTVTGNEGVLSVNANADAVPGIYKVKVEQLAEAAKITGIALKEDLSLDGRLSDIKELEDFEGETLLISGGDRQDSAEIEITKDMTVRQLINAINTNEDANARLTYSSITGKFVLQSKMTGNDAQLIVGSDKGPQERSFLDLFETGSRNITTEGQDAIVKININNERIDGNDSELKYHEVTSSSNTFTRDGITFNLFDTTDDKSTTTINIIEDVDASYDKIKKFVDSYNELIDEMNGKIFEKEHRDFPPLTAAQRDSMSEKDIELWEEKAMSGLLRNDPALQKLVYGMRSALGENVEGVDIRFSDIGITTGKWYEHGRLYIDEGELKKALAENPEQVMELFAKTDGTSYSADATASERAQRYKNVGLAQRISDILNDNIRTSRDQNGKKGLLLERAGIMGDTSEFQNVMNDRLSELDKSIDRMNEILAIREESYWRQFTAMEKAIQDMNSQSMWLAQQLNSGMQ